MAGSSRGGIVTYQQLEDSTRIRGYMIVMNDGKGKMEDEKAKNK
jgi:hypothetical protein